MKLKEICKTIPVLMLCVLIFASVAACDAENVGQSDDESLLSSNQASEISSSSDESDADNKVYSEISMDELVNEVYLTASPAESEETSLLPPGTKTPVECLMKASGEYVGKNFSISLETQNPLVFAFYPEKDNQRESLVVLYSDSDFDKSLLVVLETDYGNCGNLLEEKSCWKGTVSKLEIIHLFDYMYPSNSINNAFENEFAPANGNSVACYGRFDADGIIAFDGEAFENVSVFEDVYSRFGLEFTK